MLTTMIRREINPIEGEMIRHGIAFDMDAEDTIMAERYIQDKLIPFQQFYSEDVDWLDHTTKTWFNSFKQMKRVCHKSDIELNINSWAIPMLAEEIKKSGIGENATLIMMQGQIDQLRKDLEWEKKQRLR